MIALSNYERETIITFNEAEAEAQVYTFNQALQRKLQKISEERPTECYLDPAEKKRNSGAVAYLILKGWIKVSPSRILTEEQREELRARAALMRTAQAAKTDT